MRVLLIACLAGSVFGQKPNLPPDIDPQSNSRLPLIKRDQLSDDDKKVFDDVANTAPGRVSMYSPPIAESIRTLNSGLRATVLGSQMFEICALIAAREFDEDFEWTGHLAGAKRAGVSEQTIQAIQFNRDLKNIPEGRIDDPIRARSVSRTQSRSGTLRRGCENVRTAWNGRSNLDYG
jgi:hypothetical protein